jgi:hypothetical protein
MKLIRQSGVLILAGALAAVLSILLSQPAMAQQASGERSTTESKEEYEKKIQAKLDELDRQMKALEAQEKPKAPKRNGKWRENTGGSAGSTGRRLAGSSNLRRPARRVGRKPSPRSTRPWTSSRRPTTRWLRSSTRKDDASD